MPLVQQYIYNTIGLEAQAPSCSIMISRRDVMADFKPGMGEGGGGVGGGEQCQKTGGSSGLNFV